MEGLRGIQDVKRERKTFQDWLVEQTDLCKRATDGPWEFTFLSGTKRETETLLKSAKTIADIQAGSTVFGLDSKDRCVLRLKPCDTPNPLLSEDAEFIMEARQSLPKAIEIIRAIMEAACYGTYREDFIPIAERIINRKDDVKHHSQS
jgi:hypothetical protein